MENRLIATVSPALRVVAVAALLAAAGTVLAAQPPGLAGSATMLANVDLRVMPAVDRDALLAEDAARESADPWGPPRVAVALETRLTPDTSGTWETLADGSRLWRLRLKAPGALNVAVTFTTFDLPDGARLWVHDPEGELVRGPYTAANRSRHGRLYTPLVLGDEAVVELATPAAVAADARLVIGAVNHGYRFFGEQPTKQGSGHQGSCNIDVICADGDGWRDQIRSVAYYTSDIGGGYIGLCTGTLVNNTAQDWTPYFLTAEHCEVTESNDDSVIVYWNYFSPTCGQHGGGSLADSQTGATWRAAWDSDVDGDTENDGGTDFCLLELAQTPDASSTVYYAGWDNSGTAPSSAVCIHHPMGGEKSISFQDDPMVTYPQSSTHWMVDDYEKGTTEGGSSGSGIFDGSSKLLFGMLTGGTASCTNPDGYDIFGKLGLSWEGNGTADSRLKDWLDPLSTGAETLQGSDPSGGTTTCVADAETLCLQNGRFAVTVDYYDQHNDRSGEGQAVVFADKTGFFWFFNQQNIELVVKILDGSSLNGYYWVLYGALSDVEYWINVTDTTTQATQTYHNAPGSICGDADTTAFTPKTYFAPLPADGGSGSWEAKVLDQGPVSKLAAATCGTAYYDDTVSAGAAWFGGRHAGDPNYFFAVYFALDDFGFEPGQVELTGFCAGNDIDYGGPWPNEVFVYPVGADGYPDDSTILAEGTIYTGDGTGQYEVDVDPPVTLDGDFWILNRGDRQWNMEDFNMEFDDGPAVGNSFVSSTGIDGMGTPAPSQDFPQGINYVLHADLQALAPSPPVADFDWSPTSPTEGQSVQFTDASTNSPTSWSWAFGDGGTATTQNPTHTFATAGTYTVSLTATNSGGSDTATEQVTVQQQSSGVCVPDAETLCLQGGRFAVTVDWHDQHNDRDGVGTAVTRTDQTGLFWFFNAQNIELLVKILDGTPVNGHFWVFYGALSDVEYWIYVTDTDTLTTKTYHNTPGSICGAADTAAF